MNGSQSHAGYSKTPLAKKLGLKVGQCVCFVDLPAALQHLGEARLFANAALVGSEDPFEVSGENQPQSWDYVHVFCTKRSVLLTWADRFPAILNAEGMVWISWPKKASKIVTDLREDHLREVLLPTGLVDVKVCAIDDIWSGLKFMVRKELRGAWAQRRPERHSR